MLTVDPSQKKVVWILMAVLIGAVCVTAIRMKPASQAGPATNAAATSPVASTEGRVEVQVQNLSRNPFMAPEVYATTQARSNAAEMRLPMPGAAPKGGPDKSAIGPLPAVQPIAVKMPKSTQSTGSQQGNDPNQAAPAFALLATIQSCGGLSAVIKSSDSTVRVVNVGDTLEGGYKVRALQPGRAVLSNGKDTIVVSKPQS